MGELKAANQNIPILTKEGLRLTSIGCALYVSVPVFEHAMPLGEPSLTTRTPSACHLLVRRPQLRGLPHHRGQVPTRNTMARCDGATVEWPVKFNGGNRGPSCGPDVASRCVVQREKRQVLRPKAPKLQMNQHLSDQKRSRPFFMRTEEHSPCTKSPRFDQRFPYTPHMVLHYRVQSTYIPPCLALLC